MGVVESYTLYYNLCKKSCYKPFHCGFRGLEVKLCFFITNEKLLCLNSHYFYTAYDLRTPREN